MLKKIGFPMLAVILAIAFSAFTTPQKVASHQAKTVDLYWYVVVDNQVPQGATFIEYGSKEDTQSDHTDLCPEGTARDCMRGFVNQLNTSNGPTSATGVDQIKTDAQP